MQDPEDIDIIAAKVRQQARAVALRFMSQTARSCRQVITRLENEGFPAEIVESVISEFQSNGAINDNELARRWVVDRAARKQYGTRRLLRELRAHGVSREVAGDALTQLNPETEVQHAQTAVLRRWSEQSLRELSPSERQRELNRCAAFLMRRGYSHEVIRQVLNALT